MTPYFTSPNPELGRLIARTPRGMMYWSGTCSDPKATCGECKHYGRDAPPSKSKSTSLDCALYRERMGVGYKFDRSTQACRYFEEKPRAESAS
jgi:hypothetical protein